MKTNFLRLFLTLLVFSYVLSVSAIPATRTQSLSAEDFSLAQGSLKFEIGEEMVANKDEGFMKRRMDLETQDYGDTGANRDHDPKPPMNV
ncbi:unnamed protein product [Lupinus luteus]|uniref:Uncharacterized protein n=1 Tax=Lupinus luteus TaxID=3873 RepID=A0AAV1VQF6_LUPLU